MPTHLETIQAYLSAIERRAPFEEISQFIAPDVEHREFPNRVVPNGAKGGLKEMREASARGRTVITSERYEVLNAVSEGDRVALEIQWTGVLAVAYGKLVPGDSIRARFGVFFELKEGRIIRQNNYDCFEPF